MAARPKITSRITSLAHAFVHAIIPRSVNERDQIALYELSGIKLGECVYCGARATDLDHFKAIVKAGRPSGYFHSAENIVPSCGPCNQSKSGSHWRAWMTGSAKGSPTVRGVPDLAFKIDRLSKFEVLAGLNAVPLSTLREIAGPNLWDSYWIRLANLKTEMEAAERDASVIRKNLDQYFIAGKSN